jgi:hypothetical protein
VFLYLDSYHNGIVLSRPAVFHFYSVYSVYIQFGLFGLRPSVYILIFGNATSVCLSRTEVSQSFILYITYITDTYYGSYLIFPTGYGPQPKLD